MRKTKFFLSRIKRRRNLVIVKPTVVSKYTKTIYLNYNTMSPQLIKKMLDQNWFVSTHMKGIRRSSKVLETSKALQVLNGLEHAAAKFIRTISHRSTICVIAFFLVLGLSCVTYVSCDIEPSFINKNFNSDDNALLTNVSVFQF